MCCSELYNGATMASSHNKRLPACSGEVERSGERRFGNERVEGGEEQKNGHVSMGKGVSRL